MANILLKQVPDTSILAPSPNYIRLFSNSTEDGKLYYKDSSGIPIPVSGTSSPYVSTHEITYSDLYTLYTTQSFATGSYYLITDFESIYDQPDFYMDGSVKTSFTTKGKPSAWVYQPILVLATSKSTLSVDVYQPAYGSFNGFVKDKIKYDFTWSVTEYGNSCKGRITERIDEYGNRTDYDHRSIRFKRYRNYIRNIDSLHGSIYSYSANDGFLVGVDSVFISELHVDDIIILDSFSILGYDIGLRVRNIDTNTNLHVYIDPGYQIPSGFPFTYTDFNFTNQRFNYHLATPTDLFNNYKEVYVAQSLYSEEYDDEIYTFGSNSISNYIDDYATSWHTGVSNYILSNNVINQNSNYNNVGKGSFNNTFGQYFMKNKIENAFTNNLCVSSFQYNFINTDISNIDFTTASHVYGTYSCNIFKNSAQIDRLSYYDSFDVLNVVNINS